jgi:hypothetical protein
MELILSLYFFNQSAWRPTTRKYRQGSPSKRDVLGLHPPASYNSSPIFCLELIQKMRLIILIDLLCYDFCVFSFSLNLFLKMQKKIKSFKSLFLTNPVEVDVCFIS